MINISIVKKDDKVIVPKMATIGSAGFDLFAHSWLMKFNKFNFKLSEEHLIQSGNKIPLTKGERLLVGTGIFMAIPEGYELDIRTRSGGALKEGVFVINSPGTIDSDYRGEIGVILTNVSDKIVFIDLKQKIAQAVLIKHESPLFNIVDILPETERGEGGFGSTGK